MAAQLTDQEKIATRDFLELLNQENGDGEEPVSFDTAVKFLMARKFEVGRALDLYNTHQTIRKREGIDNVNPFEEGVRRELLTEKFTILPARDDTGAAIALFTASKHHPPCTNHQMVLKALVFQLDHAMENPETQRKGLVFIYDMTNSRYHNFDYDLSFKILNMLKGGYPARLKKVLIVTAPLWFKAPFKIMRLFVREKLRERFRQDVKVYTVDLNQLQLHIPAVSIPQHMGGQSELVHQHWLRSCLDHSVARRDMHKVEAFFENAQEISQVDYSQTDSVPSTPCDENYHTSDFESEGSKETVCEKQNMEDQEKEVSVEKPTSQANNSNKGVASITANHKPAPGTAGTNGHADGVNADELLEVEHSIHMPEEGGMRVEDLVAYVKQKGKAGLVQEYLDIKGEPPQGTFYASKAKHNLPKNRYSDVLCLDETRVKLGGEQDESASDYINANYVDGYKHKNAYISTQGPLPRTFVDFWRMIWEQCVLIIVMATRTVERSRLKCGQYWPQEEEETVEFGQYSITNIGADKHTDYTVTRLLLTDSLTNECREITHFQFTSWPDYGVPRTAEAFLDFMFHVRRFNEDKVKSLSPRIHKIFPKGPPIAIHCSAGIGRTGTFVTMDISTRRLADIGTVDINKTVRRIRSQRAFSVQMPDQYVFCHWGLIEHAQREGLLQGVDLSVDSDDET